MHMYTSIRVYYSCFLVNVTLDGCSCTCQGCIYAYEHALQTKTGIDWHSSCAHYKISQLSLFKVNEKAYTIIIAAFLCLYISGLHNCSIVSSGVVCPSLQGNSRADLENKRPTQQTTYHMCKYRHTHTHTVTCTTYHVIRTSLS